MSGTVQEQSPTNAMNRGLHSLSNSPPAPTQPLFTKDRTILEREVMAFRPFGLDEQGRTIRDLSGMSIRAIVLFLEKTIRRHQGETEAHHAISELCGLLNHRVKDPVYHVTPEFLKNAWNSYSYEFAAYLYEFCEQISGDPHFLFRGGMEKASPVMQVLARPFTLEQIYGRFPYFGNKFASGSIECRVIEIESSSATLAMRFSERTLRQFGPYRRRCAHLMCQSAQGILAAVPARVHGLPPAMLTSLSCIADDDDWCRWSIRWQSRRRTRLRLGSPWRPATAEREAEAPGSEAVVPTSGNAGHATDSPGSVACAPMWEARVGGSQHRHTAWVLWSAVAGVGLAIALWVASPAVVFGELLLTGLVPLLVTGLVVNRTLHRESRHREALIQEQMTFVESRHEELRDAYLAQEQTRVELRRRVTQLTALHRAGLLFNSTLDRDTLLTHVLETLTHDLHYDRAMISFVDTAGGVIRHARLIGVSAQTEAFAQSCQIPVTDAESPEGRVVLQGRPLLIEDIRTVWAQLHPLTRALAEMNGTKALIVVPLKTKDRVRGMLTVDHTQEHGLTQDDVELMTTVANQVAIALDNASAYQQIEEWNAGLEMKVRERTDALEQADRLRSQFLSHVSHELTTPLTSIKGFLQNLLDGLTGPLNDKQQRYVSRMLDNSNRLIRMIEDLLDRTSIEAGRVPMVPAEVDLESCVTEALEQLRPLAGEKGQRLECCDSAGPLTAWADRDRMIQVIVNLVQNAVKYTPDHGRITVTVESVEPRLARIRVRDTGPGIPPEHLSHIFDPFFRVPHSQGGGPKGLGLGLSIVKTLVDLQGGQVAAANHPEGGAEVSFTVPVLGPTVPEGERASGAARKILIVDDDPDIRQLLLDRLSAAGYQPSAVIDGSEALQVLSAERFGGVILDVGIGAIDGLAVLKQLRHWQPHLPVIMITASGSKESAVCAMGMGARAYLLKPFESGELQTALRMWFPLA